MWQHPQGKLTHPNGEDFSTAGTAFRIQPRPTFPSCPPSVFSSLLQFHGTSMAFLNGPCPFYSSTLDAFPCSLKASPILSLKILIILNAQLKCHLFSKINLNPKSKLIILFLASYQHPVSMSGMSFWLVFSSYY